MLINTRREAAIGAKRDLESIRCAHTARERALKAYQEDQVVIDLPGPTRRETELLQRDQEFERRLPQAVSSMVEFLGWDADWDRDRYIKEYEDVMADYRDGKFDGYTRDVRRALVEERGKLPLPHVSSNCVGTFDREMGA